MNDDDEYFFFKHLCGNIQYLSSFCRIYDEILAKLTHDAPVMRKVICYSTIQTVLLHPLSINLRPQPPV